MNTIIKIGLGIALALPLSAPITTVKNAYGIVETPSSFSSLRNISPKDLVPQSPMSGAQLDAIKGMAGICFSCLAVTTTVNQKNQFIGAGPVTQINQAMVNQTIINQTFSPSREELSVVVVGVQQSQTLPIPFPNELQATNLAQEIINQNLSQIQNVLQLGQSPIGSGQSLAREITISTQEIINQAAINGIVNTTTINQQFTNIPGGGFLR
jgi:hypothetical protein